MKRTLLRVTAVAIWLIMTGWFIRYEAFPSYFTHTIRGYSGLFSNGLLVKDSWMRILFNDAPLGYSHTTVDMDEQVIARRYQMKNETFLNLNLMGAKESISILMKADLDATYRLRSFSFSVRSRNSVTDADAVRQEGDKFELTIRTGGSSQKLSLDIPDDVVIYSPMTDVAMSQLKPGQTMTLKTLDPLTRAIVNITIRGEPQETIVFRGTSTNVGVLASEYMGITTKSWMGGDGTLLRQETPLKGFIAEACGANEAMNARYHTDAGQDILGSVSVSCTPPILNPGMATRLKLLLSGAPLSPEELTTPRQSAELMADGEICLTVIAAQLPPSGGQAAGSGPEFAPFLASTPFIQSAHPDIVAASRSVTRGCTNSLQQALAIYNWVNDKMNPKLTPGVPSALEVLKTMEGDCNEHTYLFTALARAAGLPCKVKVGLTYTKGSFFYHAWPAVHIGEWLEMDPTLGQPAVDATHIALLEGELENQLSLIKSVGRLNIKVLSQTAAQGDESEP